MPQFRVVFAANTNVDGFEQVKKLREEGWVMDRQFGSRPVELGTVAVYHMVLFSEEEKQKMQEERFPKELKIISVKSAPLEEIDNWIKEGYEVVEDKVYAKNAVLFKYETAKPEELVCLPAEEHAAMANLDKKAMEALTIDPEIAQRHPNVAKRLEELKKEAGCNV